MTTTFCLSHRQPRTIAFNGCYGTIEVDAFTGEVVAYHPKQREEPAYFDFVRVDLDERRAWYAARGVILEEVQPDGDILDATLMTRSGEVDPAEDDWRGEIMLAVYGAAP